MLLFHQSNRTRKAWDDLAGQLAAAGINTLTVDTRGHGERGGKYDNWTDPNWKELRKQYWPGDLDTAFQYLVSHPGVKRDVIGAGGAGLLGVDNSVETARRHPLWEQYPRVLLLTGRTSGLRTTAATRFRSYNQRCRIALVEALLLRRQEGDDFLDYCDELIRV